MEEITAVIGKNLNEVLAYMYMTLVHKTLLFSHSNSQTMGKSPYLDLLSSANPANRCGLGSSLRALCDLVPEISPS